MAEAVGTTDTCRQTITFYIIFFLSDPYFTPMLLGNHQQTGIFSCIKVCWYMSVTGEGIKLATFGL
jgi:hypothetical protein